MAKKTYQILAPAGSERQLVAAIHNGCDAVYLGLDCFNARMKAPNFSRENLGLWVDYCHFFDVKVYVAVNTSIKNDEFRSAVDTIICAYKNNADGVIVTDLALLKFAASLPKPFEVVASTQLNVHDALGAQFLQNLGASTVVCARECSYSQIEEIASTGVGVECFLHGALCVCQSGQCLLSSMVGGNSGNRGLCAQPCRKFYRADVGNYKNGGYLLSASDICSLKSAQKLLDIGVSTFKIEGRNRRAEYAGITSQVYSKLFSQGFTASENARLMLLEAFNRGDLPENAYLSGRNDGIIFPTAQNHIGVKVGEVRNGSLFATREVARGDGLKVLDCDKEVCGGIVLQAGIGPVRVEFSGKVQDGMTVCRTSSQQLSADVLSVRRRRRVKASLTAFGNSCATLTLTCDGVSVSVQSADVVQCALTKPTSADELKNQLAKIGDLPFQIDAIDINIDEIFVPKSQINALRREAFDRLFVEIVARYNSGLCRDVLPEFKTSTLASKSSDPCLAVICSNTGQVKSATDVQYVIYKPEEISLQSLDEIGDVFCFVDLPSFSDNRYLSDLLKGRRLGVVCHNVGQVQMARQMKLPYIAGTGLNIFNDEMAAVFEDAQTFFYSQELTLGEIYAFSHQNGLIFVDGEIVMMKMVHCPFKVNTGCQCKDCKANNGLTYTDELGNRFFVKRRKDARCSFELINGKKLSVVSKLKRAGRYCVNFDADVVAHYSNLNRGIDDGYVEEQAYTKGRLYNKVN